MTLIRKKNIPKPLKKGDEVRAISVSSPIENNKQCLEGLKILEGWGLKCPNYSFTGRQWGYLSGPDDVRYKELHEKTNAKLTIFTRGGWGAARLLEKPQRWKKGFFLGFSDITSLHFSRLTSGFSGCIHGPLLNTLSSEPKWSQERLKSLLFGKPMPPIYGESLFKGKVSGPLVVANLTVATNLIGSSHFPDLKNSILILEDIGEEPYRIDRMLTQWRLAGILESIAAIGFGSFEKCESNSSDRKDNFSLQDVLLDRTKDLGIPIIHKLPIGHCIGNAALPLGETAILDGNNGVLKLIDEI